MPTPRPNPRPGSRPLTRAGEAWRLSLVAVLGLLAWSATFGDGMAPDTLEPLWDLLLGVGAIVALHWRRRRPLLVALLTTLAVGYSAMAIPASLLAVASLATNRRWRSLGVLLGVVGLIAVTSQLLRPTVDPALPWWSAVLAGLGFYAAVVAIGLYLGARRELVASYLDRAETAEREQVARIEQARALERARIAREMHDVLAHRISLLSMHAGAMTYRSDLTPDELRGSAQIVQDNAALALTDLREVLGVLRADLHEDADPGAELTRPQPTLADLPELVAQSAQVGCPVELLDSRAARDVVPTLTSRTAYRVVQEALTNVRKHAPGATASVQLAGSPAEGLLVEVRNPRRDADPGLSTTTLPGAGLGLVGLRERVDLVGGELAVDASGEAFVVRAGLPWST